MKYKLYDTDVNITWNVRGKKIKTINMPDIYSQFNRMENNYETNKMLLVV